ncbi:MAG: AMP-binding protein [Aliidongia sp.]
MLPAQELALLGQWNTTSASWPQDGIFSQWFEAQAANSPDAPAVVFESAVTSYAVLNARANAVAHELRALGIGAGMLVGLCVARSTGLARRPHRHSEIGAAPMSLSILISPAERLEYMAGR